MITINNQLKMEGIYSFKVYNSTTGEERVVSDIIAKDHPNMILNSGLNALGTSSVCNSCVVGTGSTPVSASQTALVSQIASTSTIQAQSTGRSTQAPYYIWGRRTFRFGQGTAAGNLTEVGTSGDSGGLFSRALILNSAGEPTTLTILTDEWLDVTYELRIYQNLEDFTTTIDLLGTTHTVIVRPANITSTITNDVGYFFSHFLYNYQYNSYNNHRHFNGAIGVITGEPSGSASGVSSSFTNYVSGSYSRGLVLNSGLNDHNLSGGIKATHINTYKGNWQVGYTPAIPKDSFKTLSLTFMFTWARHDTE